MGTRSLTVFKDEEGREICVMYRQFDGYPEGHGRDLQEFLGNMEIVNGYTSDMDVGTHANGMGCVVAQTIAHFKNKFGLGGIYIYPPGSRDMWEEFIYTVSPENGRVKIEMKDLYMEESALESEPKWRM